MFLPGYCGAMNLYCSKITNEIMYNFLSSQNDAELTTFIRYIHCALEP